MRFATKVRRLVVYSQPAIVGLSLSFGGFSQVQLSPSAAKNFKSKVRSFFERDGGRKEITWNNSVLEVHHQQNVFCRSDIQIRIS